MAHAQRPDISTQDGGAAASAEGERSSRIGPVAAGIIVAGNMVGSGIYLLPATLGTIGSISLLGWLVALVGATILSLACSLLAALRPDDPGITAYISAGLGRRVGFQASFVYWVAAVVGNGAIAVAAASYLSRLLPFGDLPGTVVLIAICLIALCTVINLGGARHVARFSGATLLIGLAPVLLISTAGWLRFDPGLFHRSWNVSGSGGLTAVTLSLPSIAWAFLGFESAGVAALVVRDPRRNVPLATIGGVLAAGLLYAAMSAVIFGLAPAATLARSSAPLADAAARLWGPGMALAIAACAAVKAVGTLAGWTLLAGEIATSGSQIGLFPRFGRTGGRTLTVYLLIGGVVMVATTALSSSSSVGRQFGLLIDSTTLLCVIVYACCGAALLRLRMDFDCAGQRRGAGAIGLVSVLLCGALILTSGWLLQAFAAAVVAIGLMFAAVVDRQRRRRAA